jgi:phenylacetic acid degradation operon negative regulatory protein
MPSNGFEAQPQDLVMTFLGAYATPRDRPIWSGGLVTLLGDFGFSTGASRVALSRMVQRGSLERERSGRLVSYRPTPRTITLLEEGDQRIFSLGREPHRAELWTALWHAIPEERRRERARLSRRLRFLGFGSVQDGMWISPHDRESKVVSLVASLDVARYAGVMVGRPAEGLDFRALASRAWDLDALDSRYRAFIDEFSSAAPGAAASRPAGSTGANKPAAAARRARSATAAAAADDHEAFHLRTRLVHAFRRFPALDPELPDDLIHAPAHRADAVALFDRLYTDLAPTAQRHFDAVTSTP